MVSDLVRTRESVYHALWSQDHPTSDCVCCFQDAQLCDPMDCSPPGSSVHGILQARILEWVAISYSRGSSQPMDQTYVSYICLLHWQAGSLLLVPPGKPQIVYRGVKKIHSVLSHRLKYIFPSLSNNYMTLYLRPVRILKQEVIILSHEIRKAWETREN